MGCLTDQYWANVNENFKDFASFINSFTHEFDLSEVTIISESAEETSNCIGFDQLEISARLIAGKDLALESTSALGDAIILLSDNFKLIKSASDLGHLEKFIWLIPFINDTTKLDFDLRLDSRLFMFKMASNSELWLYEIYAIKKGAKILNTMGKWSETDKMLELEASTNKLLHTFQLLF